MTKRRVVLKLSGEAFADAELGYGIDPSTVDAVALEIVGVANEGYEVAIVVGGGNIFRGISQAASEMDRANALLREARGEDSGDVHSQLPLLFEFLQN